MSKIELKLNCIYDLPTPLILNRIAICIRNTTMSPLDIWHDLDHDMVPENNYHLVDRLVEAMWDHGLVRDDIGVWINE